MGVQLVAAPESNRMVTEQSEQYSTFKVAGRLYGIDVVKVQEVVKPMPMTIVPMAPDFVKGLINLRGQVATAIGLRELFNLPVEDASELMNVVCQFSGRLVSFLVDEIGDVIEVPKSDFEDTPKTIPQVVGKHMDGVYKVQNSLLSILNIDSIFKHINQK